MFLLKYYILDIWLSYVLIWFLKYGSLISTDFVFLNTFVSVMKLLEIDWSHIANWHLFFLFCVSSAAIRYILFHVLLNWLFLFAYFRLQVRFVQYIAVPFLLCYFWLWGRTIKNFPLWHFRHLLILLWHIRLFLYQFCLRILIKNWLLFIEYCSLRRLLWLPFIIYSLIICLRLFR